MNQAIGKYIADNRNRRRWSRDHLASRINNQFGHRWNQILVSEIESGEQEITVEDLFCLATIFGHHEITDPIVDIIGKYST